MPNNKEQTLRWFPLCFVLYEMTCYLSSDAYLPAMVAIRDHFQTTDNLVRVSMLTWFLGGACAQLAVAPIAEYWGRKPILLIGNVLFTISCILCAFIDNFALFLIFRFIQGIAVASMAVTGYATIHSLYSHKEAIKKIALINSISITAPAFGPLLGALMLKIFPWQSIFYGLAVLATLSLYLLSKIMPETSPKLRRPQKLAPLLSSYARIISNPQVLAYLIPGRCLFAVMIIWLCVGPFLVSNTYGLPMSHFGIAQVIIFSGYIIGNEMTTKAVDRYLLSTIICWSWCACLLGTCLSMITAWLFNTEFYYQLIGLSILSLGHGLSSAIFNRLSIEKSDQPMSETVAITTLAITLLGAAATVIANVFFTNTLWSFIALTVVLTWLGFFLYLGAYALGWLSTDSLEQSSVAGQSTT